MAPRKKNQTTAEQNEQGQELTRTQEQGGDQGQTDDQERTGDQEQTGNQEQTGQEQERDEFADIPNPCVYCGPSVRGVARQYTTYQGGIPDPLKEFIKEHPAARGLIVPASRFAIVRKRLETRGTAESIIYKKVKDEL